MTGRSGALAEALRRQKENEIKNEERRGSNVTLDKLNSSLSAKHGLLMSSSLLPDSPPLNDDTETSTDIDRSVSRLPDDVYRHFKGK